MLPPELPIFADRLDLEPARLVKPGAAEAIEGVRRGSPADFWNFAQNSVNTLVIGTK